jgi:hypothetical protein
MTQRFARLLGTALIALALPVAAHAQVGGLINKAKKAVTEDANAKPAGSNAQIGDPFDAASLDVALKGMRVFKSRMTDVAAMRNQYLAAQNRRSALQEKNQRQIDEYESNHNTIRNCVSDYMSNNAQDQSKVAQQKMMSLMSDQAALMKFTTDYTRISQEYANAISKGDTVTAYKSLAEMTKMLGIDPKADSAKAFARCGNFPRRPAAMDEMDQIGKQTDSLSTRLRTAETTADIDAARAAGVQPVRFAQMRERLSRYVANTPAFAGKEGDLLKGRRAEIEDLVKTP